MHIKRVFDLGILLIFQGPKGRREFMIPSLYQMFWPKCLRQIKKEYKRINIMQNSLLKTFLLAYLAIAVFAGNASAEIDITNRVTIELVPHESKVSIASVKVLQDGEKIVIHGTLKRNRQFLSKFSGHVDVEIISPDGKSTNSTSVSYKPRSRSTNSRSISYRTPRFKACFSGKVLKGSTVRISLHESD